MRVRTFLLKYKVKESKDRSLDILGGEELELGKLEESELDFFCFRLRSPDETQKLIQICTHHLLTFSPRINSLRVLIETTLISS